ncbi:phosphatidylglycerol lysyltransferase domain-containing protein [Bacillus coahuilensis]|uniref:phosphatidylglycerol lysyltransferase domain-containing protein n=1 Tax=Bacillus coahuilensis TaxID=408580 RepID=UPI0001850BB9|nr:phosphatidylglycerol lysyltransferase domain-containing protein [Bacillus coahuilensis]
MNSIAIIFILFVVLVELPSLKRRSIERNDICYQETTRFLQQYGGNHVSHLLFTMDKLVYWTKDRQAMILYQKVGKTFIVLGDPIGREEYLSGAIKEFIDFSIEKKQKIAIYQASANYIDLYRQHDFNTVKIGEEAVVPLPDFSLSGKKMQNLRSSRSKFERLGYSFSFVSPPFDEAFIQNLKEVSDSWLNGRKEKGFSVGYFCERALTNFHIAVLKDEQGSVVAFATLSYYRQEKKTYATIDLMRYKNSCPNGTMDMLFLSILDWCKVRGFETCSLGMAPLSNTVNEMDAASRGVQKLVSFAYHYGHRFYNFKGLYNYKNKYFPNWEPRYVVFQKSLLLVYIQLIYLIHRNYFSINLQRLKIRGLRRNIVN